MSRILLLTNYYILQRDFFLPFLKHQDIFKVEYRIIFPSLTLVLIRCPARGQTPKDISAPHYPSAGMRSASERRSPRHSSIKTLQQILGHVVRMEVPAAASRHLRCQKPGCQNGSQRLSSESAFQRCFPCSTWRVCGRRRSIFVKICLKAPVFSERETKQWPLSSSFPAFQLAAFGRGRNTTQAHG